VIEPKKYATATAFRKALEDRLKSISRKQAVDLQRVRRQVAFDRLLARFFSSDQAPWVLKGGYAMELRLNTARSTRDIDLTLRSTGAASHNPKIRNKAILDLLEPYAGIDLKDFFVYRVGQPMMDLDAPLYGGARFPVDALMDECRFVSFHVDVAVGDVLLQPLEEITGKDWLGFAGIVPASLQAICVEQQFAEKLHAYTLPRQNPNSRVRDLVDMVLLLQSLKLSRGRLANAIQVTFERRGTHPLPKDLPLPPAAWIQPFAALATECGLSENLDHAFNALKIFLTSGRS
jgi:hypothetical protein